MALAGVEKDLSALCRKMGLSADLGLLNQAWEAEMGSWGGRARVVALDHFSLVVEVDSSTAMQEVSLRRRELLRRLNRYFPSPFLQQITLRMAHGD